MLTGLRTLQMKNTEMLSHPNRKLEYPVFCNITENNFFTNKQQLTKKKI